MKDLNFFAFFLFLFFSSQKKGAMSLFLNVAAITFAVTGSASFPTSPVYGASVHIHSSLLAFHVACHVACPTTASRRRGQKRHGGVLSLCASRDVGRPAPNFVSVTSTSNSFAKRLVRLRDSARFRREEGCAIVVGSAPVRELCETGGAAQGKSLISHTNLKDISE